MAKAIRALVVLDSGIPDSIAETLPSDGEIDVVGVVQGVEAASRSLEDTNCDVLLIACAGYSDRVLFLIDSAVRQDPTRPVLVLGDGSPHGFIRRVFEVGADDILLLPQDHDHIRFAIEKALARRRGSTHRTGVDLARLIIVLGPKGGTGKTLIATNLAVALQDAGKNVILVDLDLQFGDVALCMGLPPEKTLYDVALAGSLDADKLESFVTQHPSGVKALLAPVRPDQASEVTVGVIREAFSILRAQYDTVIVDTPPGFTPEVIAAIDMSTDIVMVGMLDSLSLKNTKLGLETLDLMGYDPTRVRLVLNRAHTRVGISMSDVSAVLGRDPEVLVPSDREIPRSVNEGIPILLSLPKSEPAEAFRRLGALFVEDEDVLTTQNGDLIAASETRGRRVFGRKG